MRLPQVDELFRTMRDTVTDYPSGCVASPGSIAGTSFFPGGDGLYKGETTRSPSWPAGKILLLGNDWGTKQTFDAMGTHEMNGSTWRGLLSFLTGPLAARDLSPSDVFYSNVFMGLRTSGKSTGVCPGRRDPTFRSRCAAFTIEQIKTLRPRLILTIGKWAPDALAPLSPQLGSWKFASDETWRVIDRHGPLQNAVTFAGIPEFDTMVCALTHFDRAHLNYGKRAYGRYADERGLLEAALDEAGFTEPALS